MRALTLWRPWAWAIAEGGKWIENRPQFPPQKLIGSRIAIHTGQRVDHAAFHDLLTIHELSVPPEALTRTGEIVCTAIIEDATTFDESPWFCGPVGIVLGKVMPIAQGEFEPLSGKQGYWRLPREIAARLELMGHIA